MSPSPEKTLLLVVGMHRSGTSVLTHVLHLLGVELGEDLLPAEAGVNDRGFWEHQQVVALNERILEALDHPWYDFRSLPGNWMEQPEVSARLAEARTILTDSFGEARLAAIKDPRLCLLLPFWEQAARDAGWTPKVILATRSPAEVVASLCRRDPLDPGTALLLWFGYVQAADYSSRHLPRMTVDYHQLLTGWAEVISRLGELELDWPMTENDVRPAIEEVIDPSLKHQKGSSWEGDESPLAPLAEEVHQILVEGAAEIGKLDASWKALAVLLGPCDFMSNALAENVRQRFVLNNRHQELGEKHARALETIRARDRQLQARTREWQNLGRDLEYCRSIVEERDGQIRLQNKAYEELAREHQKLAEQYHMLATQPLVRLLRKLFLKNL